MVPRIVLVLLFCAASVASAAEVFRWVDENGKTHYGDTVPEKYRQKSKKVDGTGPEVTGAQRQEAEARNAREKAKLDALQKSRDAKGDAAQPSPDVAQAEDGCEEQMKKYMDSQGCFERFRNANGSIKPEAFQVCKEAKQPAGCTPNPGSAERTYLPPAPR